MGRLFSQLSANLSLTPSTWQFSSKSMEHELPQYHKTDVIIFHALCKFFFRRRRVKATSFRIAPSYRKRIQEQAAINEGCKEANFKNSKKKSSSLSLTRCFVFVAGHFKNFGQPGNVLHLKQSSEERHGTKIVQLHSSGPLSRSR
jgi:hypothetical protein